MNNLTKAIFLGFFFSLCATAAFVTTRVCEGTPAPMPRELYSVVNCQIAAFRSEDFRAAYRYAASGVHQKFTVSQFSAMLRRDYPQLAHARRIEFGAVNVRGPSAMVQVFFFANDGSARSVVYSLVLEAGSWKINGAEEERMQTARGLSGSHA